jgi:hypothetical protein
MADSRETYLNRTRDERVKVWTAHQGRVRAGMDPEQAEREAMRECFPLDKNRQRKLDRWKKN